MYLSTCPHRRVRIYSVLFSCPFSSRVNTPRVLYITTLPLHISASRVLVRLRLRQLHTDTVTPRSLSLPYRGFLFEALLGLAGASVYPVNGPLGGCTSDFRGDVRRGDARSWLVRGGGDGPGLLAGEWGPELWVRLQLGQLLWPGVADRDRRWGWRPRGQGRHRRGVLISCRLGVPPQATTGGAPTRQRWERISDYLFFFIFPRICELAVDSKLGKDSGWLFELNYSMRSLELLRWFDLTLPCARALLKPSASSASMGARELEGIEGLKSPLSIQNRKGILAPLVPLQFPDSQTSPKCCEGTFRFNRGCEMWDCGSLFQSFELA